MPDGRAVVRHAHTGSLRALNSLLELRATAVKVPRRKAVARAAMRRA